MNKLSADTHFEKWLQVQGYIDPQGVLTISLREAKAVFYLQDIQIRKENIERDFVEIARDLWVIYRHQLWAELGYANFVEFICSPDLDFRRSLAYSLKDLGMLLEEGVIKEDDIREIGTSKMRALLPFLKENPENSEAKEEWLEKAKVLTTLDLEDELRGHEIHRYHGVGLLEDLLRELSDEPAFWEGQVALSIKTC